MNKVQTLTERDYEDIFSLSQFAFQYELSEEELVKKQAEAKRHTIWGWKEEGKLAAKLHLIPLSIYINGKTFEMGGVSAVATWPEYRRQGMVKHLLYHALQHMKENGQTISFLHPFSFGFYRKYGWEHAFNEQYYTIPVGKLKKKWQAKGYVRRIGRDISLLHQVYSKYAKQFNGMLVRDEKWWEQRVLRGKPNIVVAYNKEGQAEGYLIYTVKDNVFTVKDMGYSNTNSIKLLLEFIGNHDSMVEKVNLVVPENDLIPLLVNEPLFEQKIVPYFMARIVDVKPFLEDYPFKYSDNGFDSLTLTVNDSFFSENSGTYQIHQIGNEQTVEYSRLAGHKETIQCSIQALSGMLLGFKSPSEYYKTGLLKGDEKAIEQLDKVIPDRQTFLADFY